MIIFFFQVLFCPLEKKNIQSPFSEVAYSGIVSLNLFLMGQSVAWGVGAPGTEGGEVDDLQQQPATER